ncbi:MAG TPA: glycosyltransferase, partial [Patescibacteria group bacterium]|nr:glycosyltransferase [Patescibacteria group bacterium]
MILGIDASRSITTIQKTGVELVSDELLKAISHQQEEIIYYTPSEISWLPRENQRILRWPFKFFWTQIRLVWELIFHPPEKMFFPVHAMPLLLVFSFLFPSKKLQHKISPTTPASPLRDSATPPQRGGERTHYFRVIHDIAFKKQPQLYSLKQKLILNLDLFLAKKLCAKIFVPTEAVRQDLVKYTKINPDKVVVTPWGYSPINNKQLTINNKKKQILYIGRVEEKKNIGNLIKAFNIFLEKHPDYKLILAGKIDNKFQNNIYAVIPAEAGIQTKKEKEKNWIPGSRRSSPSPEDDRDNVEFLGYVSEAEKRELL